MFKVSWDVIEGDTLIEYGSRHCGLFVEGFPIIILEPIGAWCGIGCFREVILHFGCLKRGSENVEAAVEGVD